MNLYKINKYEIVKNKITKNEWNAKRHQCLCINFDFKRNTFADGIFFGDTDTVSLTVLLKHYNEKRQFSTHDSTEFSSLFSFSSRACAGASVKAARYAKTGPDRSFTSAVIGLSFSASATNSCKGYHYYY